MKRFLLFLFALPLLFTACENVLPTEGPDIAVLTESKLNTEPILYEGKVVDTDYFVSATALNAYLALQPNRAERSKRSVASIEPAGPNSDVTLMYVVNYEGGGWEIISADKRTEPILAYSDYGSFSWEKANPGEIAWMGGIGEGLLHLRTAGPDAKLTEKATKEKEQNVNFWDGLELTKAFIDINGADALKDAVPATEEELRFIKASQTRWGGNSGSGEEGHYELVSSTQSDSTIYVLNHLTNPTVRWRQGSPWNSYCPTINGSLAKVGCVPLAVANVLYYLHNTIDVPVNALLGSEFYNHYPTLTDSNVWDSMGVVASDVDHTPITARFLRVLGDMCNANYGIESTSANVLNLKNNTFTPYGVSCSNCLSYEHSIVISALKQPIPIPSLIAASGEKVLIRGVYSDDEVAHCFVIDGYKDVATVTTNIYEWVGELPLDPTQIIMPNPRKVEKHVGQPNTRYICMNWGDGSEDEEWYSPTSSWISYISERDDTGLHIYEVEYSERLMITNFGIL